MDITEAVRLATKITTILKPYCKRIEVAGSIRRNKQWNKDIDIVLIPDSYHLESFFRDTEKVKSYKITTPSPWLRSLKWGPRHKQILYDGIKVELYLASKSNWGLIYLIRTGSADFSKKILAQWKKTSNGGYSKDGLLRTADGTPVYTYEEEDIFKFINSPYVKPEDRD